MRPIFVGPQAAAGVTLIEALLGSLVLGIATVGLALMLSTGSAEVIATGDDRIALGLAEQKIEQLRAGTFSAAATGSVTETSLTSGSRTFTRVTCVQFVDTTNGMGLPAYSSDCVAGTDSGSNPKRITVIVTSALPQANYQSQAAAAQLQGWIFQ